jgi:hypothetical protein
MYCLEKKKKFFLPFNLLKCPKKTAVPSSSPAAKVKFFYFCFNILNLFTI